MGKLFQSEVDLQKRLMMLVRDLCKQPNFSVAAAFNTID